jgi:hypothetical protein
MIDSDAPVSQFTDKISELNIAKEQVETRIDDLSTPNMTVSLHPAVQERYLSLVEGLAKSIQDRGPENEMAVAVRELIETVVVEKTQPGDPIHLRVNGRLSALIQQPMFPEGSLSGVKVVARERYITAPTHFERLFSKTYRAA